MTRYHTQSPLKAACKFLRKLMGNPVTHLAIGFIAALAIIEYFSTAPQ